MSRLISLAVWNCRDSRQREETNIIIVKNETNKAKQKPTEV
jgi:hypothetical protein